MDLASHITLGETLPVQAARPEPAHQPARCFGDQQYTYSEPDGASAGTVPRKG